MYNMQGNLDIIKNQAFKIKYASLKMHEKYDYNWLPIQNANNEQSKKQSPVNSFSHKNEGKQFRVLSNTKFLTQMQ